MVAARAAAGEAIARTSGRNGDSNGRVNTPAEDNDIFNRAMEIARAEAASARAAEGNWRRVVQALFALRHLQRIFKNVGDYLQEFPQTLRSALSLHIGGNRRAGGGRHSAASVRPACDAAADARARSPRCGDR